MTNPGGSSLGGQVPAYGGRVELRLLTSTPGVVEYEALLSEREVQWRRQAQVEIANGKVAWQPHDEAPADASEVPAWLKTFTEALLRGAWRARETQPWPRRITRWRSAKDDE